MFYEEDVAYIGSKSKESRHQGCGTEQQPFFIALSTDRNNNYPQFIKLRTVPKDDSETTNAFLTLSLVLSKDRTLNTDGKTTFNIMKDRITVVNEKIGYECFEFFFSYFCSVVNLMVNYVNFLLLYFYKIY